VKLADGSDWYRPKMEVPADVKLAPGKPAFERWTCGMKFSAGQGKTDIVVFPIHFKSNRPAFEKQDTSLQRDAEARMLLAALADIRAKFNDDDIIILGDTNCINKREKAIEALVAGGFVDLNATDELTYVTDTYKNPFDRAFVPNPEKPSAKEFKRTRQDVFMHPNMTAPMYRKHISDHRMIRITIDVMEDDD
jgi:predicted extracellular nuclease